MSERTDLPKIKPEGQPSVVNHSMGVGAFFGWVAGLVGAVAAPARYKLPTVLGATAIGGLLGGMQGKSKQENEQANGMVVKTPGYWNKGIISGFMTGWAVGLPIQYFSKGRATFLAATAELGGAVVGSVMRKNELQRDFDRATSVRDLETDALRSQLRAAQLANGTAPTPAASYMNSVNPLEAAELAAKQDRKDSHADKAHGDLASLDLAEAAR